MPPPSLSPERAKVAKFYSARSKTIPPLPWQNCALPFSQGISSIELGRRLGVTQTTGWKIKHKSGQVMLERDGARRLCGRIEIDDAYIGGERTGGKRGRGAPGKTPFVEAVETTPQGKPVRLELRRVAGWRSASTRPSPGKALIPPAPSSATASPALPPSRVLDATTRSSKSVQDRQK